MAEPRLPIASTASATVANIDRQPHGTTIVLAGDLDLASIACVRAVLDEECARKPARLLVDLAAVDFIDSTALNALVATHKRLDAAGCVFEVVGASAAVLRVFALTRLDEVFLRDRDTARA